MHTPYSVKTGRECDFRVKYKLFSKEEGGREHPVYQGIRTDFWYDHPAHESSSLFMIWPEYENENGEVILDNQSPLPSTGTAGMWIINDQRRSYHRERLAIGTKGWFREASKSIGECEVIEIVSLKYL